MNSDVHVTNEGEVFRLDRGKGKLVMDENECAGFVEVTLDEESINDMIRRKSASR
jgi:hypothetical protein